MLTTTPRLGLTLTTTVGVVNGVHAHSADSRALALPAGAACLAGYLVHVVAVSDGADGGVAVLVELAKFTGRHLDESVAFLSGSEDGLLSGGPGNLTTGSGTDFDVVDCGAKRNILERHVADLGPTSSPATTL